VLDRPLSERASLLDRIFAEMKDTPLATVAEVETSQGELAFEPAVAESSGGEPRVIRAPVTRADSAAHLDELFEAARERGNEGLMIKDVASPYQPGRRGKAWLKLKRELATLDVVVTAAEYGHGKRNKVLSDYTFAVRSGEELLNVGKAYSGLTDVEISELTEWFLAHTLEDRGHLRIVEPKLVLEVAFNAVMKSDRHASGYALRFPRILRIRKDKSAAEIDTLARVKEIFDSQTADSKASDAPQPVRPKLRSSA
jgi:DNA ligase-1